MPYPDSKANHWSLISKSEYVNSTIRSSLSETLKRRAGKNDRHARCMTIIAPDLATALCAIPGYKSVDITHVYPYSKTHIGVDIVFAPNVKQEATGRSGMLIAAVKASSNPTNIPTANAEDMQLLRDCAAGGYIYAQTYSRHFELEKAREDMLSPLGIGRVAWELNTTLATDGSLEFGFYNVDDLYSVQTWRIPSYDVVSQRKGYMTNKLYFADLLASQSAAFESLTQRMFATQTHPDYEFVSKEGEFERHPPNGNGWEENFAPLFSPDKPTAWCRKLKRSHFYHPEVWIEPGVLHRDMTKDEFIRQFGLRISKSNLSGIDFKSGPIAYLEWIGKLKYQIRNRNGELGDVVEWTTESVPLRLHEIDGVLENAIDAVKNQDTKPA